MQELAYNAGNNPIEDRYKCGYIAAFNDLINLELQDQETDEDD